MEENLYTRIEDYLDQVMNEEDRISFENEVRQDPAVATALEQVREVRERLRRGWENEAADVSLDDTLRQLGMQHFKAESGGKSGGGSGGGRLFHLPRLWWAVAAGAAGLIAAWLWLRPVGSENLYARYRSFDEASFTLMGADSAQQSRQLAADAFNNKDYATASKALQAYLQTHPDELELQLYSGLCFLELGQLNKAASAFQKIRNVPNNAWAEEATWYLALTYLRQNNRDQCSKTLRSIPKGSNRYELGQQLLKAL